MTDEELRHLIREAVARHLGGPAGPAPAPRLSAPDRLPRFRDLAGEASHYQYVALVNVGEACVIEPTVSCNHCGYCRSHGH